MSTPFARPLVVFPPFRCSRLLAGLGLVVLLTGLLPLPGRAWANDLPAAQSPLVTQLDALAPLRQLSDEARVFARDLRARTDGPEDWHTRDAALDRVRDAMDRKDSAAAIAALEDYMDAGGDEDSERWLWLGRLSMDANPDDPRAALAIWTAWVTATSDQQSQESLGLLARLYAERGETTVAVPLFQAALAYGDASALREDLSRLTPDRAVPVAVRGRIERDVPELCVAFTHDPLTDGSVRYADYVALDPAEEVVARADGDALCLSGFPHGTGVAVTLRAGLPLADGARLADTVSWSVDIPNREARIAFAGDAHVLPARGSQGLPLQVVNVERVALEIYRVPFRGLAEALREDALFDQVRGYDLYDLRNDKGVLVWSGEMDTPYVPNQQQSTAVPFAEAVPDPEPGLYAVVATIAAREPQHWQQRPTQWVMVTDIGLQTYQGDRETVVSARSLETALPLDGVTVEVIARDNAVLGSAVTDAQGLARLPAGLLRGSGGAAPSHLVAHADGGGDHAFLNLGRPALDLSDRGVGGRVAPGPLDAFLYLERGIYRPGETIHAMALLRDDRAQAVADVPVTLKVTRPDGVEVRRLVVTPDSGGGAAFDIPTSDAARTGAWTITAHVEPDGPAVGQVSVQIEDFVPARMEVLLQAPEGAALRPNAGVPVAVEARYLYGAPGAGLAAEAELVLMRDDQPFGKDLAAYSFGLTTDRFDPRRADLTIADTDDQGRTKVEALLEDTPDTTQPLKALVRVTVLEPGGQPTNRAVSLPVRLTETMVGLDPLFEGGVVDEDGEARYRLLAVDSGGQPLPGRSLRVIHYAEDWDYQWYNDGDGWRYKATVRDRRLEARDVTTGADGTVEVALPVEWGRYRLEVADLESGAVSSQRFRAGWRVAAPGAQDTPDTLRLTSEKDTYAVGESARIALDPPFAGEALVTVAAQDVLYTTSVSVPEDGAEVSLPVTEDWGPGAYVLVTLVRPGTDAERGPGRAVGAHWVAVDMAERTLDVTLEAPETIRPRGPLTLPLRVAHAGPDTRVTVAVVDEGILQLTGFGTPRPDGYFLGKRQLGVEMRDAYGALIDGRDATMGRLRTGGDAAGRHAPGLPDKTVKPLAFFSGPIALDRDGRATVTVDLPAFNGRVRVMAVAYDARGVGHGEADVTIRDRLVTLVTLPRFLAPEDRASVQVTLDNVDGPAGDWTVALEGRGGVVLASNARAIVPLAAGGRATHVATLKGGRIGGGGLTLTVTAPDGKVLTQDWGMSVRPAATRETRALASRLAPGQSQPLDGGVLNGFAPDTASLTASVTAIPNLGVAGLLRDLDRYPYGCVEQTVSRALPLLVLSDVAAAAGVGDADDPEALSRRIDGAIARVIGMQRGDGAFSLWGGGERADWLSAYATEFLVRAREAGHRVPPFALERALRYLGDTVVGLDFTTDQLAARAYALYVLARAGEVDPGALRYVHDVYLDRMPGPVARAHLGAALAMIGDTARAASAFDAALSPGLHLSSLRDAPADRSWRRQDPYASPLRDAAATVALMAEAGVGDPLASAQALADGRLERQHLSTQEQARLLMAAHALQARQGPLSLSVDGTAPRVLSPGETLVVPSVEEIAAGVTLTNTGTAPANLVVFGDGIPVEPPPAMANGLVVSRAFYDLDGQRVDPQRVNQSDLLVALISGEAKGPAVTGADWEHHALVVDLLPAGLVLENAAVGAGRSLAGLDWLPDMTPTEHTEMRDDRFMAAVTLTDDRPSFTIAYLARAVTPGVFTVPGVFVESMYRPDLRARGGADQMIIAPR